MKEIDKGCKAWENSICRLIKVEQEPTLRSDDLTLQSDDLTI